jgi:single-strand DNA-binding protein
MNTAHLFGRLGADPESRTVGEGKTVTEFRVATGHGDRTSWHRVVCWERLAEQVATSCRKGSLVYVIGEIQYRDWQDKDGQRRQTTEIRARDVQFASPRPDGARAPAGKGFADEF